MSWPVYVPTKGRAGAVSGDVLSLSPTLVVEPAERGDYFAAYPEHKVRSLAADGQGIGFARNGVLAAARAAGHEWVWMLDDDLRDFFGVFDGEQERLAPGEVLGRAQKALLELGDGIGAASLPVAWSKRAEPVTRNRSVYCCVALHVSLLSGLGYSETLPLKEDTDFSLRVLSAGLSTVTLNAYGYQMPVCGTHTGGLQATYAQDRRQEECALELARRWPGVVRASGKQVRVAWELFGGDEHYGEVVVKPRGVVARVSRFRPTALA